MISLLHFPRSLLLEVRLVASHHMVNIVPTDTGMSHDVEDLYPLYEDFMEALMKDGDYSARLPVKDRKGLSRMLVEHSEELRQNFIENYRSGYKQSIKLSVAGL